jgi:hypothetical protein
MMDFSEEKVVTQRSKRPLTALKFGGVSRSWNIPFNGSI